MSCKLGCVTQGMHGENAENGAILQTGHTTVKPIDASDHVSIGRPCGHDPNIPCEELKQAQSCRT